MLLRLIILLILLSIAHSSYADKEQQTIDYLKSLEIEDLIQVEVTLDAVFDVFDGLIKAKKVTVATGRQQSTARAPAVTTVITTQDIEAIGATDLDQVLATVPGLHVSRSGTLYNPIYTIRGIHSQNNPEVLMLINGIPITSLYAGDRGAVWGGMPINMISRIEVIRGPGSAVYGADAFSGVINIITKTKEEIKGTEVGVRAGSFKTYEGWALYGSDWHGLDIAASVEYRTTDGHKAIIQEDAQTQFDKLFATHASLAPGPINSGAENIDVRFDIKQGLWQARAGYQGRNHLGTVAGAGQALDPVGYLNADRTNVDLTYHNPVFTPDWDVTAQVSYFDAAHDTHLIAFPPGAMGGLFPHGMIGNPGIGDRRFNIDTFAFYSGLQKHLIRVGIGYSHNNQYEVTESKNFGIDPTTQKPLPPGSPVINVTDTPYIFNRKVKRESQYLSLQDVWTLANDWELTAGIRYDHYSDFGSTTNPRLALVWQPQPYFTSKLLYGRAFRAPSLNELYNANNPVLQGNPNLQPEVINTWELAFDYRAMENLHLATNLFYYKATDKIQYVATANADAIVAQNAGILESDGLELEARWKMTSKSSLLTHYSYARTMDKTIDYDAGNYPRHSAYLRTDWLLIPNWYLDVQANWVADRRRVSSDPRPAVADYTTVDLTLRYKDIQKGRTNIALSIRNLFDADAREPSPGPNSNGMINIPNDLPLAGRSYFLELRYQF